MNMHHVALKVEQLLRNEDQATSQMSGKFRSGVAVLQAAQSRVKSHGPRGGSWLIEVVGCGFLLVDLVLSKASVCVGEVPR
jgi:hypothetical protein